MGIVKKLINRRRGEKGMDNEKKEHFVSVIVPVYKVEQFLDRCIISLLTQTLSDFELILVDDGSPDRCGSICDAYADKDKRVRVIHQDNKGLSGARNSGIAVAKGEYICFVDSDDMVTRDYLKTLLSCMQDTGADIVECRRIDVYDNAIPNHQKEKKEVCLCSAKEAMKMLILNNGFSQTVWNKMYRKAIIADVVFPEGKLHEDEFFTWKVVIRAKKIAIVKQPLYYYFHREGSIMETFSEKRLNFFEARYERHHYIEEYMTEYSNISKDSIAFPAILILQRIVSLRDKQLLERTYPIIRQYYNLSKFTFSEVMNFKFRKGVWYFLANISPLLSARVRYLLRRPN